MTGAFTGIHMSLMRIYVLETSEKLIQTLPEEKRAKSTIKYTALFILFLHGVTGAVFGPSNDNIHDTDNIVQFPPPPS